MHQKRIGFEYHDAAHNTTATGYKAKGVAESPDASWYLQLVLTDPAFEGQGQPFHLYTLVEQG